MDLQLRLSAAAALKHLKEDEACADDPLLWLCNYTYTRDDHWAEKGTEPYARFPRKPYMPMLFYLLQTSKNLLVPKSREMMLSWAVIGYLTWRAQFHGPVHILVQCQKEEKAIDLVSGRGGVPGYTRCLYESQPDWMKLMHPTPKPPHEQPGLIFTWSNGSRIQGIPAGAEQIRQYHPACYFADEAAFLDDWEGSIGAALPVAGQLISVSSAAPSAFGDECMRMLDLPDEPDGSDEP